MPHSYSNLLTHAIFSTKDRVRYLDSAIRNDVHAYIGGILRDIKANPLMIGGTDDHVNMLAHLPADMSVSECLRLVKTNSSRWIHERWPDRANFAWQGGFASFSVSESNRESVSRYIRDQKRHHRKLSFQEEFIAFLRRNGVPFEERYLWS